MRKYWRWLAVIVAAGCGMGTVPLWAFTEARQELPIGVPDFPRRVERRLSGWHGRNQLHAGPVELHPSFTSAIEYDSNIRLTDQDPSDDIIFTQRPGLLGEMKFGDHRLEAGYGAEILSFAKEQEENTTNHLAHGLLELHFNDLQLSVEDRFENATSRLFNESDTRDHLFNNAVQALGRYDRPRWATELGWTHNTIRHRTDVLKNDNYGEDVLAALAGYKIRPKTLWLLEVDTGWVNYSRNLTHADQSYWQVLTGLRGELTRKISATVKAGYQDRQLTEISGEGSRNGFRNLVVDADVVFAPRVSDSIRLGYQRTVRTSTFTGNSWYRVDELSASYRKRLLRKWILTPSYSWQLNDYPESATVAGVSKRRADYFNQVGLELRYDMQEWMSTGLTYRYRGRNSNFETLDYHDHRIIYDVALEF